MASIWKYESSVARLVRLGVVMAVLAAVSAWCGAASEIVFEDFEKGAPWRHGEIEKERVKEGKRALRWDTTKKHLIDSPRASLDFSPFEELRFQAWSPRKFDREMQIVFVSQGGYYAYVWPMDWEGWKEVRIPLVKATKAHAPAGWDRIMSIGFRAKRRDDPEPPEGMVLVLDDFRLVASGDLPFKTRAEWVLAGRKSEMARLKKNGNPYFQAVLDSLRHAKADPPKPKKFDSAHVFGAMTSRALMAAWAASDERSPRRGDEVLISNAVTLIDQALSEHKDGTWYKSRTYEKWAGANTDRFALGPLMDAIWWLRRLPDMEENWKRWEPSVREVVDYQMEHWAHYPESGRTDNVSWGAAAYVYPNQDVIHLVEMELAHQWWGEEQFAKSRDRTIDGLRAQLLPDGGFRYIGPETECDVYHGLNLVWLARYVTLSGDERVRKMIADTVKYYPLSYTNEGVAEYYTDCWWKHYWADGRSEGPEVVAAYTNDPHNKWLANRLLERVGTFDKWWTLYTGLVYRDDIEEKPLPDNWLVLDRNIGGPRGRFGSFYFAGVVGGGARDTFSGCMMSVPDALKPAQGALILACVNVETSGGESGEGEMLYVSGPDDKTAVEVVENRAGALGARYTVRKPYINSTFDRDEPPTPWQATQVWLYTSKGLVGLVELEATEDREVRAIRGEMVFGPHVALAETGKGEYLCGTLAARVLEHNFPRLEVVPARDRPIHHFKAKGASICPMTEGESYTARPGEALRYALAVGPEGVLDVTGFEKAHGTGRAGFRVTLSGEKYEVRFDPVSEKIDLKIGN